MRLPEICIRQPVLAIVLSLILVAIGIVGYLRLEIRFFPKIDVPIVTVKTHYSGADPNIMENTITTPLENAIAGVSNIDAMNSTSSNAWSRITVRFRQGGNFEQEANAVRDKVAAERDKLPTEADPPTVTVGSIGNVILNVAFTDKNKTPAEIRDYVTHNVLPILRQQAGVGYIGIDGSSGYAMRIWLNAEKMAAYDVTVKDIEDALKSNNIDFPAGTIQDPTRDYTIVSDTRLKTPQEFGNIIIKVKNNRAIRFDDVATVELASRSLQESPVNFDGMDGINMRVYPLQEANPIDVANVVKQAMKRLNQNLPPGMKSTIFYDGSVFLKSSISETFLAILEAVALVVIVVFLFLGSLRASIVPIVTIPVCVIATFGLMYMLGFSINVMSLLALVLAIGLVVDDAIVMLENIHRHIEAGEKPLQAALIGSKEIAFPVLAMTLTLAAVYAPIGFAQGFTAVIFKEFAFTLAAAVIISGFVALSLSPMMCSKILYDKHADNKLTIILDKIFDKLSQYYQGLLTIVLSKRFFIVMVLAVIGFFGYLLYRATPSEFVPKEDTGWLTGGLSAPAGANLAYIQQYTQQVKDIAKSIPEVKYVLVTPRVGSEWVNIFLKPWGERKRTAEQVMKTVNKKLDEIAGVKASVTVPDPIKYDIGGHDFAIHLMTIGPYKELVKPTDKLAKLLDGYSGLSNVNHNLKFDEQKFKLTLQRNLAAVLGIDIQDIADTVSVMLGGMHVTDVQSGSTSYPVIVQMQERDLKDFNGINKLYVRSSTSADNTATNNNVEDDIGSNMVPLSSLIDLTPIIGQPYLSHYNRMRSSTITADLAPGYSVSQAVQYALKQLPNVITADINYAFDGKAKQYLESKGSMVSIFIMAFVFIYLVLAAQFGSFIDPLVILLAVPLSMVGGLFLLWLGGGTLNLYSQIGLVTLVGLISKHGILITEFTNELRKNGVPMREAVTKAATIRLRPIMMTTAAMVFGTLPLAFAAGPGSNGRNQIGWVVVGGLLFGTFFSLVVVPVAYTYLGRWRKFN